MQRGYTVTMSTKTALCLFALLFSLAGGLCGCGPKDIGAGTSSDDESHPQGVSTEDQLRYPMFGSSSTQRMLYYQNRPETMVNMQQWQRQQMRHMNGLDEAVDPSDPQYRAVPKQRSPFRQ